MTADFKIATIFYSGRVYVDIGRSIADIGPPALKEMIEIGDLGVSLTSPPDHRCHHLGFWSSTRVQL
ncbi:hypothetical protein [Microcoleus sp.]|uniref:hypothetical protein n=1 Tax=Microcoleus sp. TaxID=44472 RepID=UPI00403EC291